jgi:hypothetical protein
MKQPPLVLDDNARALALAVRQCAEDPDNWYRVFKGAIMLGEPQDDPKHVATFAGGYRVVFFWTWDDLGQIRRCLRVSVPDKLYPHPYAVYELADLFGFTGWGKLEKARLRPPADWVCDLDEEAHYVQVVQRVACQ